MEAPDSSKMAEGEAVDHSPAVVDKEHNAPCTTTGSSDSDAAAHPEDAPSPTTASCTTAISPSLPPISSSAQGTASSGCAAGSSSENEGPVRLGSSSCSGCSQLENVAPSLHRHPRAHSCPYTWPLLRAWWRPKGRPRYGCFATIHTEFSGTFQGRLLSAGVGIRTRVLGRPYGDQVGGGSGVSGMFPSRSRMQNVASGVLLGLCDPSLHWAGGFREERSFNLNLVLLGLPKPIDHLTVVYFLMHGAACINTIACQHLECIEHTHNTHTRAPTHT